MAASVIGLLRALLSATLCLRALAVPRTCTPSVHLAIGSYTKLWWFPSATGVGLTFATLGSNTVKRSLVLRSRAIGENPNYCVVGSYKSLYCVNGGRKSGVTRISARGTVTSWPIGADGGTHVAVLPRMGLRGSERVLTADYNSRTMTALLVRGTTMASLHRFEVPRKEAAASFGQQKSPHPHHVQPLYDGTVLVSDLGADALWRVAVGIDGTMQQVGELRMRKGDGPRHAVRAPKGSVYVINELSNTIARVAGCSSGLRICEHVQLLDGRNKSSSGFSSAAVRVTADGRFLYASVRPRSPALGYIIGFALRADGAILRRIGIWSSQGVHPRDFIIIERAPDCASYIAVANRDSNHIVLIARNRVTGALGSRAVYTFPVRTPVTVLEVPVIPGL